MTEKWCACFNLKGSMRGHGVTAGGGNPTPAQDSIQPASSI